MPCEISVPEYSAPVISRPQRINPILVKEPDAALNQYLEAVLTQHSTSPSSSPPVVIPNTSVSGRITVNYKNLNQISKLPIPRVNQVVNPLASGRVFSTFGVISSFHQIKAHKDTDPITAFCTTTGRYQWLVGLKAAARCLGGSLRSSMG